MPQIRTKAHTFCFHLQYRYKQYERKMHQWAGLDDGKLAVYLGHITKHGTPAIQTTARYTQPSLEEIKDKLRKMKG